MLAAQNIDYTAYRDDSRQDLLDRAARAARRHRPHRDHAARARAVPGQLGRQRVRHVRLQHLAHLDQRAGQRDAARHRRGRALASTRFTTGSRPARTSRASPSPRRRRRRRSTAAAWAGARARSCRRCSPTSSCSMKPGEFSEPIQSASGFQIVRLNEMRGAERTMVDQLHVRHILLRPNEILDEAAVQQKVRGIRAQIVGGDDFATIAEAVSEDTASAADGGELGWVSPGDTVPEFEQALAKLPLNELSEPIKSRFGWHLIEVLGAPFARHDGRGETRPMRAPDPRKPRPRKSASCGCGGCATRRSSTSAAEPAYGASEHDSLGSRSVGGVAVSQQSTSDRRELRRAGRHRPGHFAGARVAAIRGAPRRARRLGRCSRPRARLLGSRIELRACAEPRRRRPRTRPAACKCCRSRCAAPAEPGTLDTRNAAYVLAMLRRGDRALRRGHGAGARDGAGAKERHHAIGRRVLGAHGAPGRAHGRTAARDAARRQVAARRARDDAPAAARRRGRARPREAREPDSHHAPRFAAAVSHRAAARARARLESARRRERHARQRGDTDHRAGRARARGGRPRRRSGPSRPTRRSRPSRSRAATSSSRCTTTRACRC